MKTPFYGRFFLSLRKLFRVFGGRPFQQEVPNFDGPVVYVGHHHNLRGPFRTMQWFDPPLHLWVLHVFFDRKACFDQYYGYTLTERLHWPKPIAWVCAHAFSYGVSALMVSMRAIPVYRGTVHMRQTLTQSLDALLAGESLAIFPDVDYSSNEKEMGEIYSGFLGLDRFYSKKTGKHLSFVPLGVDLKNKQFHFGEPVRFSDDLPFNQQRDELAALLRDRINALSGGQDTQNEMTMQQ